MEAAETLDGTVPCGAGGHNGQGNRVGTGFQEGRRQGTGLEEGGGL